jgi:peptidoglycan/xylan/chitin deacetylase (PgdA/CDA1 family)
LSSDEQRREIDDSFAFVENITRGEVPRTFCYPYGGAHSFSSETERLLERAGSLFAFSVEPRDITREDLAQARQKLPRYDCNQFFSGVARAAVEEPGARLPLANGSACRKSYAPRS